MSTNPKSVPLCVCIGEVLWDRLPQGKVLGGAPVNVAAHVVQLGLRAAAISAVGQDADGLDILASLQKLNVMTDGVSTVASLPTGAVDVVLDARGVPTFSIQTPSAWDALFASAQLKELARHADAIVFGSLAQRDSRSRQAIHDLLGSARSQSLRMFDVNLRRPFYDAGVIDSSLRLANMVKVSDTELPILADALNLGNGEDAQLHTLRDRYDMRLVVYTCGEHGSRLINAQQDERHPGFPVSVLDTVGAGDAFTAAVITGWLSGMGLTRLHVLANRVASFVCSQSGATPRLPLEIVEHFLGHGVIA